MNVELEYDIPDIAIVHVGSNDLANGVTPDKVVKNIKIIVEDLNSAGVRAVVISGLIGRKGLKREIQEVNSLLKKFCKDSALSFIDNRQNIWFSKAFMSKDRIHLNHNGGNKLLDNFIDKLLDIID